MKVLKEVKLKTKDDLCKQIKEKKILPFFLVYHKMVQFNIINPFFYIIVLIIEYISLFFELANDGEDYITPSDTIRNSSTYHLFKWLQYINYSHFINKTYLSYDHFLILYIIVICLILINFLSLIMLDLINKYKTNSSSKLKAVHAILGLYNFLSIKILIIPLNYVLFESYQISTYKKDLSSNGNSSSMSGIEGSLSVPLDNIINNYNAFDTIGIKIITSIVLLINIYSLINTSLLFNDLDPFGNQICWAQSYPQIEMYNINLKIALVLFNIIKGKFLFIKSIFALIINCFRCSYRYYEWYYAWSVNKILLVVLDFFFLFYNLLTFIFGENKDRLDLLICFIVLSMIFGITWYIIIEHIQKSIISKRVQSFNNEHDFCQLIMQILQVIRYLPQDNKTLNDSIFFGFLIQHKKYCTNTYCTARLITNIIYNKQATFANDIDDFIISKSELSSYCKTDKNDNFEMFQDTSKVHCEKTLYYVIKCIIDYGMRVLPSNQISFLPILESYVYMHIFNNKFYALFEVMKYYKPEAQYREKFFFFMSLSNIMCKMSEESNIKYTSMASLISVTDYYYFHNKFTKAMRTVLNESKNIFVKLISMQPSAKEVLFESEALGIQLKKLHKAYEDVMKLNHYEINVQRLYTFAVDLLFEMKTLSRQYRQRLQQNIKSFQMNDKFKNPNTGLKEIQSKMTIKNFQENSDSAIVIISGILENIGEVLYCNELLTTILGYHKEDIIGFSVNLMIPQPIASSHNQIILNFYKTGERNVVDKVKNRFGLHKNGSLVNIDVYVTFMPNIDHGIMFIGILKNSYVINLKAQIDETKPIIELISKENNNSSINKNNANEANILKERERLKSKSDKEKINKEKDKDKEKENLSGIERLLTIRKFTKDCGSELLSNKKKRMTSTILNTKTSSTIKASPNKNSIISKEKQQRKRNRNGTKQSHNGNQNNSIKINNQPKPMPNINFLFKAEETGIIILNKRFDILHTNIYVQIHFLGISKPLPIGKVNMKKLSKEFLSKVPEMERGETVPLLLDLTNVHFVTNQFVRSLTNTNNNNINYSRESNISPKNSYLYNNNSLDESAVSTMSNKKKNQRITSSVGTINLGANSSIGMASGIGEGGGKPLKHIPSLHTNIKNVKVSLTPYTNICAKGKEAYYILTIQSNYPKETQSPVSSNEDIDDIMMNYDDTTSLFSSSRSNGNNRGKSDSNNEQFTSLNHRDNSKSIENIKIQLLDDKYMSGFTKATNITIYTLLSMIIIWLIVSYVLELQELLTIRDDLRLHNRNEILMQIVSHYIIESLLLIRANTFFLLNVKLTYPLLTEVIRLEESSINTLLQMISADTSTNNSNLFRYELSEKNNSYKVISEKGIKFISKSNLEMGINSMIFSSQYLIDPTNYEGMSEEQFLNPNYFNQLKTKFYFIYSNYFSNFHDNLDQFSTYIENDLYNEINDKSSSLLIIFIMSIVFCIIVSVIVIITLINQEHRKKEFLILLGNKQDTFYSEKIALINQFKKSMEILLQEDQNMHRNKQLLDKDEDYKEMFVSSENFLNRKEEDPYALMMKSSCREGGNGSTTFLNRLNNGSVRPSKNMLPLGLGSNKDLYNSHSNLNSNNNLMQSANKRVSPPKSILFDGIQQQQQQHLHHHHHHKKINSNITQPPNSNFKTRLDASDIIDDNAKDKSDVTELDTIDKEKEVVNNNQSRNIFSEENDLSPKVKQEKAKITFSPSSVDPNQFPYNSLKKTNSAKISLNPINNKSPEDFILTALNPISNPNLINRSANRKHTISAAIINLEKDKEKDKDNELLPLETSQFHNSYEEKEYIHKSYTHYTIPWKKSFVNFIISTVYLSSFFIISIVYLTYYLGVIKEMVKVSSILCTRAKLLNNLIIAQNINMLYVSNDFISSNYSITSLKAKISKLEDEYKSILTMMSKSNPAYNKILNYESNRLCDEFVNFNTTYNLIDCETFLEGHGLSFEIASVIHYIYEMELEFKTQKVDQLMKLFNDQGFINIMVENTFYLRLFLMDIIYTHEDYYNHFIWMTIQVFHVKFAVYSVLLIILIAVYQMTLLPSITETINNLTRVKLYFDEKNFQK